MKKYVLILLLFCSAGVYAQNTYYFSAGTQMVSGSGTQVVFNDGNLTNNGTITDPGGTVVIAGNVIQSGTGVNDLYDITVNSGASFTVTSAIKVKNVLGNSGTFVASAGAVNYSGTNNQDILPVTYDTLNISGSGNKTLTGNTNVTGGIGLAGTSKLITDNNLITLKGNSSTITGATYGGAIPSSWIVTGNGGSGAANTGLGGLVIENIGSTGRTSAVTFPVGPTPSLYDPIQLTNSGVTDNFTVAVNDQPVPGAPIANTINSTWIISEALPGGTNATIATQWNGSQENGGFTRGTSAVVHSTGTVINYNGGVGSAGGSDPYTLSGTGFTSFSPFGVTSDPIVLPITQLAFSIQQQTSGVLLHWTTEQETGSKNYLAQRSTDEINYTTIGTIAAEGYSINSHTYNFYDANPATGQNYYRIKEQDINGAAIYSNIEEITFANASSLTIVNPVHNKEIQIEISTVNNYVLYDLEGKPLLKGKLSVGYNIINVSNVSSGLYILQIGDQTERIVIE